MGRAEAPRPPPAARAGSGGADARPRPRHRPAARAHLSPSPHVGRRLAQARRARGQSRERESGARAAELHRAGTEPTPTATAAAAAAAASASKMAARRGGAIPASGSGARLVWGGGDRSRRPGGCRLRLAAATRPRKRKQSAHGQWLAAPRGGARAILHVWSASEGPPVDPSAAILSGWRPRGESAAAADRGPPPSTFPSSRPSALRGKTGPVRG